MKRLAALLLVVCCPVAGQETLAPVPFITTPDEVV